MNPSAFTFFTDLFNHLNGVLAAYFQNTASSVISSITPVVTTMLMIYMMFWGWAMMRGVISEPVTDGVQRMLRLTVIVALGINLGLYNSYVTNFLWNAPDAMAAVVASGNSSAVQNTQFLDTFMGHFWDLYSAFVQAAQAHPWSSTLNIPDMFEWFIGIMVLGSGILLCAYAAFLLILSKIGLALLLAVGPIFIVLAIFTATQRFFDSWCGQTIHFIFLIILTSGMIKLFLSLISTYLVGNVCTAGNLASPNIASALPVIVYCAIGLLVFWQVPSISSALGGGIGISSLGAVRTLMARNVHPHVRNANRKTSKAIGNSAMAIGRKGRSVAMAVWGNRSPNQKNSVKDSTKNSTS